VGLIADTHGLVRPEALRALAGVERILHAGDVGHPDVLDALERIAPVTAVRGNVDRGDWAAVLPDTAELEIGGAWIHMLHIIDEIALDPAGGGFRVVVFGHSHAPSIVERRGVLYVNPGSAGRRRFKLPVTLARMEIAEGRPRVELVELA
jgi:putative phosphoesterase